MATTSKALFRGAATTTVGTTLYTVPSSTTAVVTEIVVTNTAGSSGTFTISLNDVSIATTVSVARAAHLLLQSTFTFQEWKFPKCHQITISSR
jgi:hypothetical protein